jgi:hypothetical protein
MTNSYRFFFLRNMSKSVFNQIIISARSISLSVSSAVAGFSSNFNAALKPQIIKEYAKENRERMFYFVFRGIAGA